MCVRVDAPRQYVLAGGVDRAVGMDVERLADQGDPLVLDEDVSNVVVRRRDDTTALDQDRHDAPFSAEGTRRAPPPRELRLLPSRGDLDVGLVPVTAVDVQMLLLQDRLRRLGDVGPVRLVPG